MIYHPEDVLNLQLPILGHPANDEHLREIKDSENGKYVPWYYYRA